MKVTDIYLEQLKKIFLSALKEKKIKVLLFGSRARGDAQPGSDIDIGILAQDPDDLNILPVLREQIEESTIPFKVDVINLNEASDHLRTQVLKEGILWKDYS